MRMSTICVVLIASLLGAALTSPATAQYLAETREVEWSNPDEPDLLEEATDLGTAVTIYEFVRNEFGFVAYDGARSNSTNTFQHRMGNDVDIASVLIAMLRSRGIPARYAEGPATFDQNDVMAWLELPNATRAANYLANTGHPSVTLGGGRIGFTHTWVQALVPLESYRAAGDATLIDCNAQSSACTWVDLDASFKLHSFRDPAELVDVSDAVFFDFEAFYNADNPGFPSPDGLKRSDKGPLEVYEEQILQHLQTTPGLEGKSLEDVVYKGQVIREEHGLLPTSTPFRVDPLLVQTFASVSDHDNTAGTVAWTKTVSFTLTFPKYVPFSGLTLSGGAPIPLADLSTQNLTFTYESTDFDNPAVPKQLVSRLGGQIHEVLFTLTNSNFTSNGGNGTISGDLPDTDTELNVNLSMDAAGSGALNATYPGLALGGYYLVATGGDHSSWGQVHRSADRLIQAVEQNPVVQQAGILYVDTNGNGSVDPGEVPLLEDASTQILLTAGVLSMAKDLYYARIRDAIERVADLQRTLMPPIGFLGVVSSVHDVASIDGTAFQVIPKGLLVDMKAITVAAPFKIDSNNTANGRSFRLGGHIISSLEHEIWQELTGFEAISTMKGIQTALEDGGTLMTLDEAQSEISIANALTNWGFQQTLPSGFTQEDLVLFSHRIWLPRTTTGERTLSVIREVVDAGTATVLRRGWDLKLDATGGVLEPIFRFFEDLVNQLAGLPNSTPISPPYNASVQIGLSDPGCISAVTVDQLESNLPSCFASLMNRPELQSYGDYLDFFDKNASFSVGAHLHRDYIESLHILATSIAPIRNEIIYGADSDKNGVPEPNTDVEFVVPSIVADGELIDFAVWIARYFNASGSEFASSYIINRAGGGYVSGAAPVFQNDPFNIGFNNELFSDSFLSGSTNNSPFTLFTGDPIATVTGNVFHDEQDLHIKGRGLDYLFTRTYNSGPTEADPSGVPMGHKWAHSYNVRLIAKDYGKEPSASLPENTDGLVSSITYVEERGGESIFGVTGDPSPTSSWSIDNPRGTFDTLDLSQGASQLYTLRFRNGTEYVFGDANLADLNATARLLFIRDPYGNELSLGYTGPNLTSIQDNLGLAGRTGLTLSYFGDGRLQQITDWTGRTWKYTYDADANLTSVADPLGNVTTYAYGPQPDLHRLSYVAKPADRDGNSIPDVRTTFDYYANGRGFSNDNSFGKGERVEYDLFRKRSRITNPRGFVSAHFYDSNGELTKMTEADGGISTYLHNPDGRRWSRTSALGHTTQYSYCAARSLDGCATDTGGNLTLEADALGNTIEYEYDSALFDQLTRVKDKNDNQRLLSYFAADDPATRAKRGKLHEVRLAQLGPLSNILVQDFTYNTDGTMRTQVEYFEPGNTNRKRTTTYSYTDNGLNLTQRLTVGSDGTSRKLTALYDALGRRTQSSLERRASPTDPTLIQLTSTYNYDAADRLTRVTDAMGNQLETDYDANSNVIETRYIGVDPQSGVPAAPRITERIRYDDADRIIEIEDIEGNKLTFSYDASGNQASVTDFTGVVRLLEYDSRNRVTALRDENGHIATNRYDQSSRLIAATDPSGNTISHAYDALGRRIATRDALGNLTSFTYDASGNPTGQINANANADPGNGLLVNSFGQSLTRVYDQLGRVVQVTDAMDAVTEFEYDLLGNRTRVTDAKGQVTEFVYDDLGRLAQVIDPIIESPDKRDTWEYDEAGNVIASTDREGNTVRTTYDLLNRAVTWNHVSSGDIDTRRYNAFGNVAELLSAHVTYTFGYDTRNLLTSKLDSRLGRSLLFEYDAAGRPIKKTDYQGEETYFQYDGSGRLIAERNPAYLQVSYHYDPSGRLLNRILSNGAQTDYTYDAGNRLLSLTNKGADGSTVHTRSYTRDAVGNITATGGTDGTIGYSYDALHRLLSADLPGTAQDRSFGYDAVGNRLAKTTATETLNYLYGGGNRLNEIRLASDNTLVNAFVYDDNGAMLEKRDASGSAIWSLSRDARGRVATLAGSGLTNGPGSLQYDMQGARVRQDDGAGTRLFHLDGDHLEAVYDGAGTVREKYLRGVVIDEVVNGYLFDSAGKPENLTFHHDHLNSVVALTGHSGTAEEATLFSPFGETLSTSGTTGNAMRYTGRRQIDGAGGLYYYRARYYDPEIGRFLSEDPLGFGAGINFYAYVENNPVNANDPSGKLLWHAAGAGIGGGLNLAAQLIGNGGDWSDVRWTEVAVSAAGGAFGVGLGNAVASGVAKIGLTQGAKALAANVGGNMLGGSGINATQQVANNYFAGNELSQGVGQALGVGAITGGIGTLGANVVLGGLERSNIAGELGKVNGVGRAFAEGIGQVLGNSSAAVDWASDAWNSSDTGGIGSDSFGSSYPTSDPFDVSFQPYLK